MRIPRLPRRERRGIVRDESGLAAVEFALLSAGMFMFLSGAVDVINTITIHRDLDRFTAEAAQVLASCKGAPACAIATMDAINTRRTNIAPKLGTMQLGMAYFDKANNRLENMGGTMTYLPSDMNSQALSMLANGDKGVAVLATYTHQPIILGLADDWGFTTKNFRAFRVNLSNRPT